MKVKKNRHGKSKDLLKAHQQDLCKSGLTDKTIRQHGIYSCSSVELRKLLGRSKEIGSGYVIPYPDIKNGGFHSEIFNVRLDKPIASEKKNKKRKYIRPTGQRAHLYVPVPVTKILKDNKKALFITEGEKKSLKATQEGFPCIALSGVWAWSSGKEPLPDFDEIEMADRPIYICFDADKISNKNVALAEARLAEMLTLKGADVHIINLESQEKLDDVLIERGDQNFKKLIKDATPYIKYLIQKHPVSTTPVKLMNEVKDILRFIAQQYSLHKGKAIIREYFAEHFECLTSANGKHYLSSLIKEVQEIKKNENKNQEAATSHEEIFESLQSNKKPLIQIHPAQDYAKQEMFYAAQIDKHACLLCSSGELIPLSAVKKKGFSLEYESICIQQRFSKEGINKFLADGQQASPNELYKEIYEYIGRYLVLPSKEHHALLTLWVMGTYVFTIFRTYPYIWLNAEKGSGKTLVMQVLAPIAFNGDVLSCPSAAVLYRSVSENKLTMFIDEAEYLSGDKDLNATLISVLNSGFDRESSVYRMEKGDEKQYITKKFCVYGPKMIAGIKDIAGTLRDRSIIIKMLKKKSSDEVERYKATEETKLLQQKIRDKLYIFGLTQAKNIAQVYEKEAFGGLDIAKHITNREMDLWEGMLVLAAVIDDKSALGLVRQLCSLSKQVMLIKRTEDKAKEPIYQALDIVQELVNKVKPESKKYDVYKYRASKVYNYVRANFDYPFTCQNSLTSKLKKLGVQSKQEKRGGRRDRFYFINVNSIYDWLDRYGYESPNKQKE